MRRFRAQVRGVVESSPAERNCLPTSSFCCCSLCWGLLAPSVVSCLSSSSCTQYQCLLDSHPRFDARQRYSEGRWYRSKRASLPPLTGVSIWTMSLVCACSSVLLCSWLSYAPELPLLLYVSTIVYPCVIQALSSIFVLPNLLHSEPPRACLACHVPWISVDASRRRLSVRR